jgi:hypothetical protein
MRQSSSKRHGQTETKRTTGEEAEAGDGYQVSPSLLVVVVKDSPSGRQGWSGRWGERTIEVIYVSTADSVATLYITISYTL